ncbi:hypothetical protein E3N88_10198 [Mikania micrantha]|uniref:Uncharacterized protein n=1 Tax=Mikania micrantha TaxID=192012 RepID=A0A5N6PC86_9ASTR|nr:hypothetical protein E3N88_10198 [Mikania micrantha]
MPPNLPGAKACAFDNKGLNQDPVAFNIYYNSSLLEIWKWARSPFLQSVASSDAHWVGVKLRKQSLASSEKLHRKRFHSHSRKAGVYPVEEAHSIVESFFTNEQVDGWIVKPISLLENLNQVRPTRFWGVYTRLKIFNMTNYEKLIPNSFLGTFMKGSDWL